MITIFSCIKDTKMFFYRKSSLTLSGILAKGDEGPFVPQSAAVPRTNTEEWTRIDHKKGGIDCVIRRSHALSISWPFVGTRKNWGTI